MKIYLNNGEPIPSGETCYIIAKDGIYLQKNLDLVESITPVDKISFLEEMKTFAKLNIPKIPAKTFSNILEFFKEVYSLYKSEAIVLLFYNKNKKTYRIYVPEQTVSGASLDYKADVTIKDHILIGTIHSHAGMSAFHSGTDVKDEENFDGIHFTIGKVNNKDFFDVCATISINGMRIQVFPEDYVDGLNFTEYTPIFPNMFKPSFTEVNGEKIYSKNVKSSFAYTISETVKFKRKDWLKQVSEKKYTHFSPNQFSLFPGININNREHNTQIIDFHSSFPEVKRETCDFTGICKSCVYRNLKLEEKDIKEVDEKDCKDNFEVDFSNYDFWGW